MILVYLSTIQFRADRSFKTAKTYAEMGRLGEAIPGYDQSIKLLPYEGGAITHYAIALLNYSNQLGEPQRSETLKKSKDILEYGMRVDPYNADNFYIESRIFLMTGDTERAIEFANKALKIDPYYAEAHLTLANVYERRGQAQSAKEHYNIALRINPSLAEPKLKSAWSLYEQGRYEESFQVFQELMIADPKNADVHNGLGSIYAKRGDKTRAKEEFEQTLILSPGNAYAQKMLQWLK
jgi:tetratricopeptide (TPR) repeat protein